MSDLNVSMILRLVDRVTAPARPVMATMRKVQGAIGETGQAAMRQSERMEAAVGNQVAQAQRSALGLGAIGAAIAGSLKPAIDFEAAMDRVAAVSGARADQLSALSATARELGSSTNWSASEAAAGMQELAMAGFEVNEIITAMPGMLDLASAGQVGLGEAADIASNILSGFGLAVSDTGRLADVMTNTFTGATVTLDTLGETMKYVAPNAASVGMSMEMVAAMTGKLGDAGIRGSMAGTALRAMISRLSGPTGEASKALERLGVETADAAGNLRPMESILAELDASMTQLGSAEQAALRKVIFGEEASAAAQILMLQAASGELQTFEQSLHRQGSAAEIAAKQNENFKGLLSQIGSLTEAVSITIGTVFLPALTEMVEQLRPLLSSFNEWAEANPELVTQIGQVVLALVGIKAAILVARLAFVGILGPVVKFLNILGWILRIAAMANPFVLLIAGVVLLAVMIYRHWDEIWEYFTDKIAAIQTAFQDGFLNGILEIIKQFDPSTLMNDLMAGISGVILDEVNNVVRQIAEAMGVIDLYDAGIAMIQSLWEGAEAMLVRMVAAISGKLVSIAPPWMLRAWNWVSGDDADDGLPGATDQPPLVGGSAQVTQTTNVGGVVVNAKTNASPQEIAQEVRQAVRQAASSTTVQPMHDGGDFVND